jgi:hypothetical protein
VREKLDHRIGFAKTAAKAHPIGVFVLRPWKGVRPKAAVRTLYEEAAGRFRARLATDIFEGGLLFGGTRVVGPGGRVAGPSGTSPAIMKPISS